MSKKEIVYGRDIRKAMKPFLHPHILIRDQRLKSGLIKIGVVRKFEGEEFGMMPLIEIGENAPFKLKDLEELCELAGEKIEEAIEKRQNEK